MYNNDTERDQLHHEEDEHPHSDYKADPDSNGHEHDAFNESDTEMLNGTSAPLAGKQTNYEDS